jgi:hypothetical protein
LCSVQVCASPECSIFYSKRFCGRCIQSSPLKDQLPPDIASQIVQLSKIDDSSNWLCQQSDIACTMFWIN